MCNPAALHKDRVGGLIYYLSNVTNAVGPFTVKSWSTCRANPQSLTKPTAASDHGHVLT